MLKTLKEAYAELLASQVSSNPDGIHSESVLFFMIVEVEKSDNFPEINITTSQNVEKYGDYIHIKSIYGGKIPYFCKLENLEFFDNELYKKEFPNK